MWVIISQTLVKQHAIYVKPAITVMELIQLHKLSVLKATIALMVLSMQINTLAQLEVMVLQQV